MCMMKTKTIQQDSESGELYIEFSNEELEEFGWEIGDTIVWTVGPSGSFSLTAEKKDSNE